MSKFWRWLVTPERVRVVAIAGAFAVIAGTFLTYQLKQPPTQRVDGIYSGDCGRITIRSNEAAYAGHTAKFRLVFDKFGLVGELDRSLGPFYVQDLDGKREPGWLSFDKNIVTAVNYGHQECIFRRVNCGDSLLNALNSA